MMFSPPSRVCSPTTTQIFEVPISRPAMMLESSNIFPPDFCWFNRLGYHGRRRGICKHPAHRNIVRHRQIRRGDVALVRLFSVIVNLTPPPQLLLHVVH